MPEFFFKTAPGQPAFSEEVCTQAFEPSRPYPQNPLAIIYRARFKQLRAYYTKPVPNTPHPNLPQVYFVDDVDFQDKMAGLIEWTRIYSTCPTSWNDFASTAYTFPGLSGIRVPVSKTVTEKIVQDYFLVGNLATFQTNIGGGDNFSAWAVVDITRVSNSVTVPSCAGGTITATQFSPNSASAQHYLLQTSNAAAGIVFGTVFMRSNGVTKVRIQLDESSVFALADYDLSNGLTTLTNGNSAKLDAVGDGWWRASLKGISGNANTRMVIYLLNNAGADTFAGNPADYVGLWRPQVVQAATVPHATVPPTTAGDGTNYPIANADGIAIKFGLQYIYQWSQNVAAEYLDGGTAPNINTWNGWVSADAANGNSNSYSVESADSTLSLWQGSIWQRQRHFVKAR